VTTATATMTAPQEPPTLDRVALWLLMLFVASLQMSIFAAGILLSLMIVCWVALLIRDRERPAVPDFVLPLAVYAVLTLISSAFALEPWESFKDDKQLIYLAIVPAAVYHLARGKRATTVVDVIVTVGAAGAAWGVIIDGRLAHVGVTGFRDLATKSPVDSSSCRATKRACSSPTIPSSSTRRASRCAAFVPRFACSPGRSARSAPMRGARSCRTPREHWAMPATGTSS